MEVLLGTPPPPPPPDVSDLEATPEAEEGRLFTVRERLEMHRASPACRSCHRGRQIEAQGELYDGTPVTSAADLRAALLARPVPLVRAFTENLLAYALGRRVEYYDMPTVRSIARQAAEQDHRMSAFILGVVHSPAFRLKGTEAVVDDMQAGS